MFLINIIKIFKETNKKILQLMKNGLVFSFAICIIATLILFTYLFFYHSSFLYLLGLTCFKIGTIIAVEFIICGLSVDAIANRGL